MHKNIVISSWPSAGGSTMAMMLANILRYKYVYAGWVLKTFAKEMFGSDSGDPFMKFENEFGTYWDDIWEGYAEWMLENERQMLMEGMTAGFLYPSNTNYRIYYTASVAARAARSATDGREDPEETIRRRDIDVRNRWIRDLGVDIYDEDLIAEKYNLRVDGSEMTIVETLLYTVRHLNEDGFNIQLSHHEAAEMEATYWRDGKQHYHQRLEEQNLLWDPPHVFRDWQRIFPEKTKNLPQEMRDIMDRLS